MTWRQRLGFFLFGAVVVPLAFTAWTWLVRSAGR